MTDSEFIKSASLHAATKLVKDKLLTDDAWLVRGLVAIYNRQTADEQRAEETKLHNRVGFNGSDANILTSFAKQWQSRQWLSDKQMGLARRKMVKYAGQLVKVAKGHCDE